MTWNNNEYELARTIELKLRKSKLFTENRYYVLNSILPISLTHTNAHTWKIQCKLSQDWMYAPNIKYLESVIKVNAVWNPYKIHKFINSNSQFIGFGVCLSLSISFFLPFHSSHISHFVFIFVCFIFIYNSRGWLDM